MNLPSPVHNIPQRAFYIPYFISEEEENQILNHVYAVPKPKWTNLSNRRLQNWGGIPHSKGMIAEEIPSWLIKCIDKLKTLCIFPDDKPPNHVLVNEYQPGQGIMPHLDGPLFYPTVCTITCGSHAVLNFHPPQDKFIDHPDSTTVTSLLLERRSLVIIQEDLYHLYLHSIDEKYVDIVSDKIANLDLCSKASQSQQSLERQTRISLTIRHVPQTTKFKIKLSR